MVMSTPGTFENAASNFSEQTIIWKQSSNIPLLAKELEIYKISHYILTYLAVPIAVWGCFGNFFSFR